MRMLDLLSANGEQTLAIILVSVKFVQGLFVAQCLVSFGSMIADIVDEHELLTQRRQEGIFFAAVAFSSKCTTGLGNVFAALLLISLTGRRERVSGQRRMSRRRP